jgi:hypothetical protein
LGRRPRRAGFRATAATHRVVTLNQKTQKFSATRSLNQTHQVPFHFERGGLL